MMFGIRLEAEYITYICIYSDTTEYAGGSYAAAINTDCNTRLSAFKPKYVFSLNIIQDFAKKKYRTEQQ